MRLKDYPRPANDTGLGIHSSPNWTNRAELGLLDRLYEMGMRWIMLFVGNDEPATHGDIRRIMDAGFEVILRFAPSDQLSGRGKYYTLHDPPCVFPVDLVRKFVDVGVKYIRTGNEPQLRGEWDDADLRASLYPDQLNRVWDAVIDFELRNGANIRRAGGIPVVSDMRQRWTHKHLCRYSDFWARAAVRGVLAEIYEEPVGQSIHPRPLNRPASYPYDRGEGYMDDWLRPEGEHYNDRAWCANEFDLVLPITQHFGLPEIPWFSTEAGYEVGWSQDPRYSSVEDPTTHGELNLALARYRQRRNLPQWFAECFWHIHRNEPGRAFTKEAWFDNEVYGFAEMPVVGMFAGANFPAVRDELFEEGGESMVIDIVDELPRSGQPPTRPVEQIDKIVIHHVGLPYPVTPQQTASYHTRPPEQGGKGWPCIGYHYFIGNTGMAFQTARHNEKTYHVGEHNPTSLGICLSGRFDSPNPPPTEEQREVLASLCSTLLDELGLDNTAIKGHYELRPTVCPGAEWFEEWREGLGEPALEDIIAELEAENAEMRGDMDTIAEIAGRWVSG